MSPQPRLQIRSISNRLLRATIASTMLAGGILTVGAFDSGADSSFTPRAEAAPTDGTCGPLRIAMVIDMSTSFTVDEWNALRAEAKRAVRAFAADTDLDPQIAIYGFARTANVGDAKLVDKNGKRTNFSDGSVYEDVIVENVPANAPLSLVDVTTANGLDKVISKIDGLQRDHAFRNHYTDGPPHALVKGDTPEHDLVYAESNGTNWDAALKAVQDSSDKYDTVLFLTDGTPNMVHGQDNRWDKNREVEGSQGSNNAFRSYEYAMNAAEKRVKALERNGTDIVPVFMRTTGDPQGNPTEKRRNGALSRLSGNGLNGVEGKDYFYAPDAGVLYDQLISAATQQCSPVVQIDKKVTTPADQIVPGGEITYDVTVRGSGDYRSEKVVVRDLGGAGIVPDSIEISGVSKGKVAADGSWSVGDLAVGEEQTATVTARIDPDHEHSADVVNDITVTSKRYPKAVTGGKPNDGVREDDDRFDREIIETVGAPDVKINKERLGDDRLMPGDSITYRLTVKNADDAPVTAKNVVAQDLARDGLQIDSIAIDDGSKGEIDGNQWLIGELEPGETVTATVTATLTDEVGPGQRVVNDAIVNADHDEYEDGDTPNDNVDEDDDNFDRIVVETPESALKVNKEIDTAPEELSAGDPVEYTIQVRNDGPDAATGVKVNEQPGSEFVDGSVEFVDGSWEKGEVDGLTWNVGTMAPGETLEIKVRGILAEDASDAKPITNVVSVEDPWNPPGDECIPNEDGLESDTDQCDSVVITPPSELQVDKNLDTDISEVGPNGEVTYTITARNAGNVTATDVMVDEHPLAGLDPESIQFVDPSVGEITEDGRWSLGDMAPGATETVTVTANLVDGVDLESFTNATTISNPPNDPPPVDECIPNDGDVTTDNDQCDTVTTPTPESELKIDKVADTPVEELAAGEEMTYTVTVKNDGPDAASDVKVTEQPGAQFEEGTVEFVENDDTLGSFDGLTWNVGTLQPGETTTITVKGKLREDVKDNEQIVNNATVENPWNPPSEDDECIPNDDVDSDTDQCDTTVIDPPTDLQVDKNLDTETWEITPDGEVTYTITAHNPGTFTAADVRVSEHPMEGLDPESIVLSDPTAGEVTEDGAWAVGDMAPGATETITVTGKLVDGLDLKEFTNATTIGNERNPEPENPGEECEPNEDGVTTDGDQCDIVTTPAPEVDVKIHKELTTPKENISAGGDVTFAITVKNAGPDAAGNITVEDMPIEGLDPESIVLSDASQGEVDENGIWHVGALDVDGTATVVVTGKALEDLSEGDKVVNHAIVDSPWDPYEDGDDPNDDVDGDDDNFDGDEGEAPNANLKVRKALTDDPSSVVAGGTITYTVEAMNDSGVHAHDVVLNELPALGIDPGSITLSVGGEVIEDADPSKEGFQWVIGSMAPGERVEAVVTAAVSADATSYTNYVTVENPNNPPVGDPGGECVDNNDDVLQDGDQCDVTSHEIPPVIEPPIGNDGGNSGNADGGGASAGTGGAAAAGGLGALLSAVLGGGLLAGALRRRKDATEG